MKNNQDNTGALSALLRTADSVDTLVTNSLCCAAAGIIATSNATAEALIPHEKLRGAALADATLHAQERPLAQPVVGYMGAIHKDGELLIALHPRASVPENILKNISMSFHAVKMTSQSISILSTKCSSMGRSILKNTAGVANTLKSLQCGLQSLFAHRLRNSNHQRLVDTFQAFQSRWSLSWPIKVATNRSQRRNSFLNNTCCQRHSAYLNAQVSLATFSLFQFMSSSSNHKRADNRAYGTYGLDPSSSVIKSPTLKHQEYSRKNKQRSWGRQGGLQQCISFEPNFLGKHLWLLAIIQFVIVNKSSNIVHGGVV